MSRLDFLTHLAQTSPEPLLLEIERAEGCWMWQKDGTKLLDLISGISVSNVGHRHPAVLEAITAQLGKYMHLMVYGEVVQSPQTMLAKRLSESTSGVLNQVFFTTSGGEAVEGALKLAKKYTKRSDIVAFRYSYHGNTHGALAATGGNWTKHGYAPFVPGFRHIAFGQEADFEWIDHKTAAVIIEAVQGEAGVRSAPNAYWQSLRAHCTAMGTLLILDEIQTGFGRTGTFWKYQTLGIVPDILISAKGLGGGMPLGAFLAIETIMGVFKENPVLGHITTFGGHPVCCAASLATFDVIENERLVEKVAAKAQRFAAQLVHPRIKAFRYEGLLMGLEIGPFQELKPVIDKCIELGLLTDWFLYCDDTMRIAPPLTISTDEIDFACATILTALDNA